jgi:hypothetical protein
MALVRQSLDDLELPRGLLGPMRIIQVSPTSATTNLGRHIGDDPTFWPNAVVQILCIFGTLFLL